MDLSTGFNRRVWFAILQLMAFTTVIVSILYTDVDPTAIVTTYLVSVLGLCTALLGSKTIDNSLKASVEKEKLKVK